jgi:hypothetical protein
MSIPPATVLAAFNRGVVTERHPARLAALATMGEDIRNPGFGTIPVRGLGAFGLDTGRAFGQSSGDAIESKPIMSKQLKLRYLLAVCMLLAAAPSAFAATYKMPVENGQSILKIFVDHGTAKRVSSEGKLVNYEVTLEGDACERDIHVMTEMAGVARLHYNVCSEAGFSLGYKRVRR